MKGPPTPAQARKLLSKLLGSGARVTLSGHCKDEMAKDGLDAQDVEHVLRTGTIWEPAEEEKGTWRHRVHTDGTCVVVAFAPDEVIGVTAWRKKR